MVLHVLCLYAIFILYTGNKVAFWYIIGYASGNTFNTEKQTAENNMG